MIDKKDLELSLLLKESMIQQLKYKNNQLEEKINKAIEYIKTNCILSDTWEEIDFANFVPIGNIKYKSLSSKKVKDLLNILQGSDKE